MSVLNYKFGPWWADEDGWDREIKRKSKRADERDWKKQIQQEIEDMEQDDE